MAAYGPVSSVLFGLVLFGSGRASHGNHLHGRRGSGFDAARWDGSWRVGFALNGAMRVRAMRVMSCKPPSCWHGGRSTRPWWDCVWQGAARSVTSRCGRASLVNARQVSSVLGTTPVQARFPIDAGGVGCLYVVARRVALGRVGESWGEVCEFMSRQVEACYVPSGLATKLVQARCRINAGGLGCTVVGYVMSSCVLARRCQLMPVEFGFVVARFRTAIAVGAVRLRRLVAGCKPWHGAAG
jgi:hypothetical protein